MDENTTPLNKETGDEFAVTDQATESAAEVQQENAEGIPQEEVTTELSDLEKLRQQTENLNEALRQEREERKRYRDEVEAMRAQTPTYVSPEERAEEETKKQAREALRGLGLMTKEDVEAMTQQERQKIEQELREKEAKQQLDSEIDQLAKEFDGSKGAKFDKAKALEYMKYGADQKIFNLRTAFIMKHLPEITASAANTSKPVSFPTQGGVKKSTSMPDLEKMSSAEIIEWQKSQGLAN